MILVASAVALQVLAGCGDPGPGRPILDTQWEPTDDTSVDPFPDHRPADVARCLGPTQESGSFEVNTGLCPYLVAVQDLMDSADAGAEVRVELTHLDILASGTGHVALAIAGNVVWEINIDLPKGGTKYVKTFRLEEPVNEGDQAVLHLHNHGANSWYFKDVTVTSE
jgi:hypothetical protein